MQASEDLSEVCRIFDHATEVSGHDRDRLITMDLEVPRMTEFG